MESDIVLIDLHTRVTDYKQTDIDYIISNDKKVVTFDEFDRGNMSDLKWPYPLTEQQTVVMNKYIDSGVHFCRLLDKTENYQENLRPYEKPIYHQEKRLSADELFNREYDVVFIANQSRSRDRIAKALKNDGRLKCLISIGAEKISFQNFLSVHKAGKMFISSGAGGFTDERKQCLFSVSALIQESHNQLLLHPFKHMDNCLIINNPPTQEDLATIADIVNNKEKLYEIYSNTFNFMKSFYSEEYISSNILNVIIKHFNL